MQNSALARLNGYEIQYILKKVNLSLISKLEMN